MADKSKIEWTEALRRRFWGYVDHGADGCWLWLSGFFDSGYGQFRAGAYKIRAHRAAWALTRGPIPDGICVLHSCDNPPCVNPAHLFLGTHADNAADREAKGRGVFVVPPPMPGEANPAAKLDWETVRRIRARAAEGSSLRQLSTQFGISPSQAGNIVRGSCWRDT